MRNLSLQNNIEANRDYYEAFWYIMQNYNLEDSVTTLCNKLEGHNLTEFHNLFDLNYKNVCVTIVKEEGKPPRVLDEFEYWIGLDCYELNIRN